MQRRPSSSRTWSGCSSLFGALVAGLTLASCSGSTVAPPQSPPPPAAPRIVEGMNLDKLGALSALIRSGQQYPDLHSLLIQRNGRMVLQRYYNGSSETDLHTMQSVTKSFASALVGIAIDQGHIAGVEERVVDFFPQWRDELILDPRRAAQRLEDVLTMRTGTDYHENGPGAPHWVLNALATGWDRFWLDRPMIRDPGGFWQYDSGGAVAVSAMLEGRTGMHADRFADATLFDALDIRESRWFRNSEGHVHTGGGLDLRARDMIKLGQLFLQGGVWDGEQVIPADWVEASTRQTVTFDPPQGRVTGYGYFWWTMAPDPRGSGTEPIYGAFGARAQYIFVVPEYDLVVGVTGDVRDNAHVWKPIDFLYAHILTAIER